MRYSCQWLFNALIISRLVCGVHHQQTQTIEDEDEDENEDDVQKLLSVMKGGLRDASVRADNDRYVSDFHRLFIELDFKPGGLARERGEVKLG